ncbi:hypothetical protein F5146DRAFT_1129126 [Armillaria mellea]|nr:hypothetical protein F5146DRAFT_1129126 [Armillaria mellea]
MTSHMPMHGVPLAVPSELIPQTRAELADARWQCTEEKGHQKEEKAEKKKQQKHAPFKPSSKTVTDTATNDIPRVITPVISSPSSISADLPPVDKLDAVESMDELPPMSSVATSESEGPTDHVMMDMDSLSEHEEVTREGSGAAILNEGDSDDAYIAGQLDGNTDSDDEQVLFQKFLMDRQHANKGAQQRKPKVIKEPPLVHPQSKNEKKQPAPKMIVDKLAIHDGITGLQTVTPTPASRKTVWKFEDLPLPTAADIKLFKINIVLPVLDWVATLENHFSANSHSDLKPTVTRLWTGTFVHLPKYLNDARKELCVEHPAVMGIAADGHGAYLGCLIIETMAYHVQCTLKTPVTSGPPAGALALAAAAVKRALQVWKKGVNMLAGKQSKNSPDSFGEDLWGRIAKQHYKNTKMLSTDKWNEIYLRCWEFSMGRKGDDEDEDEDSDDVDMSE